MKAKKIFGQHFLKDKAIIQKIMEQFPDLKGVPVMEVGPGMGVLTEPLLQKYGKDLYAVEVDLDMYDYLKEHLPTLGDHLINKDFLRLNLSELFAGQFIIIGNFPYNISSQIVFKVLEYRNQVPQMLGMFQKEVARRIISGPGSKEYGIISVLVKAYYDCEYLIDVPETAFNPPPKIQSAVIRLTRNDTEKLPCNEKVFVQLVKMAFNQRRKMLRNSIKSMIKPELITDPIFVKRPEQLSLEEYIHIVNNMSING